MTKTVAENWDSKAPSAGTILAYLETTVTSDDLVRGRGFISHLPKISCPKLEWYDLNSCSYEQKTKSIFALKNKKFYS